MNSTYLCSLCNQGLSQSQKNRYLSLMYIPVEAKAKKYLHPLLSWRAWNLCRLTLGLPSPEFLGHHQSKESQGHLSHIVGAIPGHFLMITPRAPYPDYQIQSSPDPIRRKPSFDFIISLSATVRPAPEYEREVPRIAVF